MLKNDKDILYIIGFVVFIMIAIKMGWIPGFQALIVPETLNNVQYVGSLSYLSWYQDATIKPITAGTVEIGDYRIEVSKNNYGTVYGEPYCETNICNGEYLRTDENGCDVWGYKDCKWWYPNCDSFGVGTRCSHWTCSGCECRGIATPREYLGSTACNLFYNREVDIMDGCIGAPDSPSWYDGFHPPSGSIETFTVPTIECGGQKRDVLYTNDPDILWPEIGYSKFCEFTQNCECWYKADIYKNNELIETLDWASNNYEGRNRQVYLGDLSIRFMSDFDMRPLVNVDRVPKVEYEDCGYIQNVYIFSVPSETFETQIDTSRESYLIGEQAQIDVTLINDYQDVKGNLKIDYGDGEVTEQIVNINKGENTYLLDVPTSRRGTFSVKPEIDVLLHGNQISGLNGWCYKDIVDRKHDLNTCQYILLGTITEDTKTIDISYPSRTANLNIPQPSNIQPGKMYSWTSTLAVENVVPSSYVNLYINVFGEDPESMLKEEKHYTFIFPVESGGVPFRIGVE